MKVIAKHGAKCPMEGKPRDYIGDDTPAEVPESSYYLRLIDDGSLIRVPDASGTPGAKGAEDKRSAHDANVSAQVKARKT